MFEFVLEYLRVVRFGEGDVTLPTSKAELQALQREAVFYSLPGLVEEVNSALAALASSRVQYDSIYVETGYHDVNHQFGLRQRQPMALQVCSLRSSALHCCQAPHVRASQLENALHHRSS